METSPPPPPLPLDVSAVGNAHLWAVSCHVSAILGLFHFPGQVVLPLIIWLLKRGDSPIIDAHGKEAVNFQLSMLLYMIVAGILCLVLIGFVLLPVLLILNALFVIIAAIKAGDGKFYRYPMTIRFIQ